MSGAKHTERPGALRRFKPYATYKGSGVEWLGEIPGHWEVKRLRSTLTSCQNGVWGDEPNGLHDIICVRVADFDRVSFRVDIDDLTARSIEPGVATVRGLQPGDLLLEKSGGGENQPVGAVVLYDHTMPAVCSNFVARVTIAAGNNPRFLTYLHAALYSLRINTRHIKQSTGIQNLDSKSYLSEATGLPTEPEQRAIAEFLDRETERIEALVAKKERLIALLIEQRSALITRAVTKGLDPTVPMKDAGVEWLGEIPAHWEMTAAGRLIEDIEQGWSPVAEDRQTDPEEWAVIKISAVSKGTFREAEHKALPQGLEPDRRYEIQKGDFLMTRANTPELVADVCVVRETRPRLMLSDLVYRLNWRSSHANTAFLAYWYLSGIGRYQIEVDARGASQSMVKVSQRLIRAWSIVRPPLIEQHAIAAFLNWETARIDTLIAKIQDAIDRLKELRTALISAAVTGKIDVREDAA